MCPTGDAISNEVVAEIVRLLKQFMICLTNTHFEQEKNSSDKVMNMGKIDAYSTTLCN